MAAEGAAGLAVEISYPEFHPGVARGAPASVSIELDSLDAGLASSALGIGVWLNNSV